MGNPSLEKTCQFGNPMSFGILNCVKLTDELAVGVLH